jgi:hypothetical protein
MEESLSFSYNVQSLVGMHARFVSNVCQTKRAGSAARDECHWMCALLGIGYDQTLLREETTKDLLITCCGQERCLPVQTSLVVVCSRRNALLEKSTADMELRDIAADIVCSPKTRKLAGGDVDAYTQLHRYSSCILVCIG